MASASSNLWVLLGLGLAGILMMTKKFKKVVKEDFGAFIERFQLLPPPQPAPPKAPHPLTGLSFAVSDLFNIEGFVTGFGNPDWARTHEAAVQTSPVVSTLVDGGATCVGKTVIDEMGFSISGENKHVDTPTNPVSPAHVPGGSSSGAAVAVAAKLVDFSLGVDTVGGVRLPAGYCGALGFRPSFGSVSHLGIIPISASLDTVGWFAMDPNVLHRVGHVLLQVPFAVQRNPRNIFIANDCFQLLNIPIDRITQVVIKTTEKLFGRQVLKHENLGDFIGSKVPTLKAFDSKKSNGEVKSSSLRLLANVMLSVRRHEFKQNHHEWINSVKPTLDSLISAEFHESLELEDKEIESCNAVRNEMRSALNTLLKDDGILVIPTFAHPPPKLGAKELLSEDYLTSTFTLTSLASLSGCCQVAVPLGFYKKSPVSVSFIARHGGDRFLLDTVQTMYVLLQQQADEAGKPTPSGIVVSQETSAEIAKEKGNQAFKDKNWQRAIGFYTDAIKLNSNSATYYSNRAAAYLELGSFLQAEVDCTKAIELDKKNVKAYFRRGTAREMLGYYKEAIEERREVGRKMDSPSTPGDKPHATSSLMDNLLGLLRVRVKRGVNLAVRDLNSSDPYIVVKMGKQRLKTRVVHKNVNPEWNEDLTLSVQDPNLPIKLTVYDHDTFSMDDKMGDAIFDIKEFLEALRMHLDQLPSNTVITRVQPCRSNCLAEESCVIWKDGRVVQELCLRLRNVECGEVELELHWIDLPGAKGV